VRQIDMEVGKDFDCDKLGRFLLHDVDRFQPGAIPKVEQNAVFGKCFVGEGKNEGGRKVVYLLFSVPGFYKLIGSAALHAVHEATGGKLAGGQLFFAQRTVVFPAQIAFLGVRC